MNDIERQRKLETDAIQDGVARYAESFKYHLATGAKPVNDLLAIALRWVSVPMGHKQVIYSRASEKLPPYVIPMMCLSGEKMALIALGAMFNAISRSEPKPVRIKTADHKLLIYKEDETRKIDPRKQMDGITAHLVHSFDAAHMMRTANRLYAEGIRHFVMVHDSYGVHAADIDTLNRILREEFVDIYSEPVLKNFLNELRKANPGVKQDLTEADLELPFPGRN
jgi:hypothetical protein